MEDKIYRILRKHKLPLKKREELIIDLLPLFVVSVPKGTLCDKCYDTDGFYLGTTCPKCKQPFRSVKA